MKNRLTELFLKKNARLLNVYCTAGYPGINSTPEVLRSLQQYGADIIEVGIPYSDPLADGPVIQQSNVIAIENGMTLSFLFAQLQEIKKDIHVPLVLMGYFNPILQYGAEKFCADAAGAGVSGIILPDLPMYEYKKYYQKIFTRHGLCFIFLITPQTSPQRIKEADALSTGFLYAVSSSSVTGSVLDKEAQKDYFERLRKLKLKNPLLIGFGIGDKATFDTACDYAAGAVTGSAYIRALGVNPAQIPAATETFIRGLTGGHI